MSPKETYHVENQQIVEPLTDDVCRAKFTMLVAKKLEVWFGNT